MASDSLAAATGFMRAFGPDVVLCDPRTLGGLDADAVHRLGDGGCPVVVLTSSLQAGEADDLRRAGAEAVLLKGCGMSDLLFVLDAVGAAHHGSRRDTEAPAPASTQR